MAKVLLFGEPMALLIADTPGPLEDVEHFTRAMSGAEVNVAIGQRRLGHESEYLTRLGDDPYGRYIEKALEKNGIQTSFITFDPVYRTGIQLKSKTTDGSDPQAPDYRKGSAASHLSPENIDALDLADVDLVNVTGIPPALSKETRAATKRLLERAKAENKRITFDPNLRPALWESQDVMKNVLNELAGYADVVLPGIEECQILCSSKDPEKIAAFYKEKGVPITIIKDGKKGAWLCQDGSCQLIPGFTVEKVVDTVGAGDGFAVGVISGLLEDLPFKEAVFRGNAIGAIQVTNIGDNEGLPTREALKAFMNQ